MSGLSVYRETPLAELKAQVISRFRDFRGMQHFGFRHKDGVQTLIVKPPGTASDTRTAEDVLTEDDFDGWAIVLRPIKRKGFGTDDEARFCGDCKCLHHATVKDADVNKCACEGCMRRLKEPRWDKCGCDWVSGSAYFFGPDCLGGSPPPLDFRKSSSSASFTSTHRSSSAGSEGAGGGGGGGAAGEASHVGIRFADNDQSICDHFVPSQRETLKNLARQVHAAVFAGQKGVKRSKDVVRLLLTRQARSNQAVQGWKATVQTKLTLSNRGHKIPAKDCYVSMHGRGQWRVLKVTADDETVSDAKQDPFDHSHEDATVSFTFKQACAAGAATTFVNGKEYEVEPGELLFTSCTVQPRVRGSFSLMWTANRLAEEMLLYGRVSLSTEERVRAAIQDEGARLADCQLFASPTEDHYFVKPHEAQDVRRMPLADFMEPIRKFFTPGNDLAATEVSTLCHHLADRMLNPDVEKETGFKRSLQEGAHKNRSDFRALDDRSGAVVRVGVYICSASKPGYGCMITVGSGSLVRLRGEPFIVSAGTKQAQLFLSADCPNTSQLDSSLAVTDHDVILFSSGLCISQPTTSGSAS